MLACGCLVIIECLLVDCFPVLPSCVLPGYRRMTLRACDRLHLRHRSSYQVRGSIYHAYNFQLTVPSSRIERLLILPPYIYASIFKPKQPCPSTSQQTLFYVTIARCSATASMHARIIFNCYHVTFL